ncbi:hypothetical protein IFM89_014764 [Coptis chinensis]|uniref:Zinc finger CCCH domain-containing protein 19 n=1 Tax=Coptis chinensis TaxID=261450 RepID=A0A835M8Y8_9MAGN|nr:hypothetical protein IFM89_014764 [Coptis chinensis]
MEGEKDNASPMEGEKDDASPMEGEKDNTSPMEGEKDIASPMEGEKDNTSPMEGEKDIASPMEGEKDDTEGEKDDASLMTDNKDSTSPMLKNKDDSSPMVEDKDDASPVVDNQKDTSPGIDKEASPIIGNEDDSHVVDGENVSHMVNDEDDVSPMAAEEAALGSEVETEMDMETEMEMEVIEEGKSDRKRKRGRPAKVQGKAPLKTTEEEDVCFICFDGGNLVLCDRRACPKAYHPACVNRDEAFFRSKGRWNCVVKIDLASLSLKMPALQGRPYRRNFQVVTLSTAIRTKPSSVTLERQRIKIKHQRPFMAIKTQFLYDCTFVGTGHDCLQVKYNTLFSCICLLCESDGIQGQFPVLLVLVSFYQSTLPDSSNDMFTARAQVDFDDKNSWEYLFKEYYMDLKRKLSLTLDVLSQARNPFKGSSTSVRKAESSEDVYDANDDASGSDGSAKHHEVSNSKRRRPKRRSKSSKDEDLPSVTHVVGVGTSLTNDADWASKELLEFVAHMKNGDKSVLSQFDVQALLLEYIKQNNLRDPRRKSQIVCDSRLVNLFGKARVGHFEMLKLLESHFLIKEDTHTDDIQGTGGDEASQLDGDGTSGALTKASADKRRKSRKKGDRGPQANLDDYAAIDVHNIKLLYLRRNLMEDLLEDGDKFQDNVVGTFVRIRISGAGHKQDMYRLVQVVGTRKAAAPYKTGKRLADVVLEILNLNKSEVISIDTISNQDFSEDECKRLRQSIKCGLISRMTVGEVQDKAMALQAVRVNDWLETEKLRISHLRDRASEQGRRKEYPLFIETDRNKYMMSRDAGFSRKGRDPISPGKGSPALVDTRGAARKYASAASEPNINSSAVGVWDGVYSPNGTGDQTSDAQHMASATGLGISAWSSQAVGRSGPSSGNPKETAAPLSTGLSSTISETEKLWCYQDPSGKTQGPFSMVQLRKWSTTGHFPVDLKIWKTPETQEDAILLNDALAGKFSKPLPHRNNSFSTPEKVVALSNSSREVNLGGSWKGTTSMTWTDKNQMNLNWKDASSVANGNTKLTNSDAWGSGSAGWVAQTTDTRGGQSGSSWRGGDSLRGNMVSSGRVAHNPHPSFTGHPHRPTSHQWGQSGGRWSHGQNQENTWNSNRSLSSSGHGYDNRANTMGPSVQSSGENWRNPQVNSGVPSTATGWGHGWVTPPVEPPKPVTEVWNQGWGTPSVETPKSVTEGWGLDQSNSNSLPNLPSPTPKTNSVNWPDQVSDKKWSATPTLF